VRERLFGTDGMRGRFGEPPLDRLTVTALGRQLALWLAGRSTSAGQPRVILGGDTRESTPELCGWIAAGLAAGGADVSYAGVIPTPGVSHLVAHLAAAAGVVVSASHNPYPDNGVKLLDALGRKWSAEDEAELEERLLAELSGAAGAAGRLGTGGPMSGTGIPRSGSGGAMSETGGPMIGARSPGSGTGVPMTGTGVPPGGAEPAVEPGLREIYLHHLAATARAAGQQGGAGLAAAERPLAGLRVVLDAGNGAASRYAGELFEALGAEVVRLLCAAPDGRNVNLHCGSTAPESMAAQTVAVGAHLGVAFDGAADRCILADERGGVRDGDAILYLWATSLLAQGLLEPPRIVATSMSNLGLERALARHGIGVVRCGVGDRAVVETMRRGGILLGGEQSGHIVRLDLAATGDGLLTAAQIAMITAKASGAAQPLSALLAGFHRYPQVLLNVPVARKPDLASVPGVAAAALGVERALGADGRLVLRYSGTEPLARVMIEGPDQAAIETMAARLAAVIAGELGSP
jgi:phosphoglucosamine mutase